MRLPRLSFGIATACLLMSACQQPARQKANDAVAPKLVATWLGHAGAVRSLAVSPDGATVVSASDDMTLRVWRVATGEAATILRGHGDKIWSALFGRDGQEVVSAGFDACVKRWDLARGIEVHSANCDATAQGAACLALCADGRRIATGGFDSLVWLWDLGANAPSAVYHGHSNTVWSVAFAPDGERVFSGSFDGSIREWSIATGACVATWTEVDPESRGWKRAFALAPDGRTLLCGGAEHPSEWDLTTGTQLAPFHAEVGTSTISIAASADGRWLATRGFDGHLALWDRTSRTMAARWPAVEGDGVWAVTFLPDGQLLSAGDSGAIKQWRLGSIRTPTRRPAR